MEDFEDFLADLGLRTQVAMVSTETIARLGVITQNLGETPTYAELDAIEAEMAFEAARLAAELGDTLAAVAHFRRATALLRIIPALR